MKRFFVALIISNNVKVPRILDIRKGEYEKAARFFKNNNSYNATLAKVLNGNTNVSCNESTASAYYLNAILGARNNNESATITNLKKSINHHGTTIINFQFDNMKTGDYKSKLNVYGRKNKSCKKCNNIIHYR